MSNFYGFGFHTGRLSYGCGTNFDENPFQKSTDTWREWNEGWRWAQLADPRLTEEEKNAGA